MTATPVKPVTRDPTANNPPSFMNQDVNIVIQTCHLPALVNRQKGLEYTIEKQAGHFMSAAKNM